MRRKSSRKLLSASVIVFTACAFLFFGCGGSSGTTPLDGITPAQNVGELSSLEKTIYTESYAGYLVVYLNESTRSVTLNAVKSPMKTSGFFADAQNDESLQNDNIEIPTVLQPALVNHPTVVLKRSISISPEQMDERRRYLEAISGKQLTDFNLIYHVEVADPDEAVRMMRELISTAGVDKVYPKRKTYVAALATVPDLTGQQNYLYSNESYGGLNAQAAWTAGARGAGVFVMDNENGWNFYHEDLPLDYPDDLWPGMWSGPPSDCYIAGTVCIDAVAHGTAVAGIIAAQDNGHGTTGFAPDVDLKAESANFVGMLELVDGEGDYEHKNEMPEGSILVMERQTPGRLSPFGSSCYPDPSGCVPLTIDPENFAAAEILTAAGVLSIEAAANGSVDLGDSATYYPDEVRLYEHDAGTIIVGASQGSNHQKISFSNYGSPVDAYAWGQGVVTTAAPDGDSSGPYYWTPGTGSNPPNDDPNAFYTNRFGGTSSATAMVAGAAALLQSHAKNVMGEPTTRYLMPLKMREILVSTGVAQSGGGGNIGRQPRLDQAIAAVDTFWTNVRSVYPVLASGGSLTESEMLTLRGQGLGIICGRLDLTTHEIVGPHDPACPDLDLWPPGTMIAKSLDFDGDGRADLVSWTNGQWKVDLSSVGSGGDNYGAWDLILNYTPIVSRWVWPYVEDFNSDGREDFAVYDKEHGKWYIAFTDSTLLGTGIWPGWDWEIDYSAEWMDTLVMDPWDSQYSRPAPGDYNGDGWMDIAIACSDGYWRIDYGGANRADYGVFDLNVQYLNEARLREAPGWAYLTTQWLDAGITYVAYKIPDGFSEEGRLIVYPPGPDPTYDMAEINGLPREFGGNHFVPLVDGLYAITIKNSSTWKISRWWSSPEPTSPQGVWGGLNCRPAFADFDGDGEADRAAMCPNEWRIAYTSVPGTLTTINLGYNTSKWTLPGRSYSGGINYSFVLELIAYAQETNPTQPPPIPVDMASMSVCSLPVDDPAGECN